MPAFFEDFGRNAYDLLRSGYNLGTFNVNVKSVPTDDLTLKIFSSHNFDNEHLFGTVGATYKLKPYGISISETWNTNNDLSTKIEMKNEHTRGVLLRAVKKFSTSSRKNTSDMSAEFANEFMSLKMKTDLTTCTIGTVVLYNNMLIGYETGVNMRTNTLSHSQFAVGYQRANLKLHSFVKNGKDIGGTIHHQVNKNLEIGTVLGWSMEAPGAQMGAGFRLKLNDDSAVQAKLNSVSEFGFCFTQRLAKGLKCVFSVGCDLKKFTRGRHEVGFAIEYEQPCCD